MDKIEKIKEWLKPYLEENRVRDEHKEGFFHCAMLLNDFIDTLSEEPDKSLEEAAEEYRRESFKKSVIPQIDGPVNEYGGNIKSAFIAGAKWQKSQMLKDAKDGYVSGIIIHNDGDEEHYAVTYPNGERPHSITDKVKIIIL